MQSVNGSASLWLHWCATVIALLHLGLEAACGGRRRSSLTVNSSWNSDSVCPLASENINILMQSLIWFPFFFYAMHFQIDRFVFCLLLFSAVFCLRQLLVKVSDTSYPLFSDVLIRVMEMNPWPCSERKSLCNCSAVCTRHTKTYGSWYMLCVHATVLRAVL